MNFICNLLLSFNLTLIVLKEYSLIQTYHYEISKYFYHLKNKRHHYWYFIYCLLGVFVFRFIIVYFLMSLLLSFYLIKEYTIKYTGRIKRLLLIHLIITMSLIVTDTLKYVFILPFLYLLALHFISSLLEEIIYLKYLKKAKKKIKDKYVIGVTGSAGKTSIKNIIYDLLSLKFNVDKTPKSFNNKMGITKSINDEVSKFTDYFICEYGVDRVGGMDRLLRIVKPRIAIISEIGNQHLLSFKRIDNILKEKIKLAEATSRDGAIIINNDNKYLREYDYKNKRVLTYGIDFKSDVMARNIELTCEYSEFDLLIKNKFIKRVRISLLSRHSVENVLAGICTCLLLNMQVEEILVALSHVSVTKHRLESKMIDGTMVIDDGYNSNYKGFKEALELLKTSDKYKILITPGIIEQGKNNLQLSLDLAKLIIESVDFVYLVSENSKYIKEEFIRCGYKNFKYKNKFIEAFNETKHIHQEKIILIENDLPSIYLN